MTRQVKGSSGYTLIEVMTVIGIVGILLAAALPHLDPRRQDLETILQTMMGDLRVTRAKAISSGVHFSFHRVDEHHYELRRHLQAGTDWPVESIIKTTTLPSSVSLFTWPDAFEFNTRGMLVTPSTPAFGFIGDYSTTVWHEVLVWPSGQVYADW